MSFRLCLAALLFTAASAPAVAQDAQSLVSKNLEARGGAAALAAIKNVSFEGRTIFPGDFEVTYKETRARVGSSTADRVDFGVQGLNITQAYDGRDGWRINPLQGRKDAEKMSADEARSMADNALIEGPLLLARADGQSGSVHSQTHGLIESANQCVEPLIAGPHREQFVRLIRADQ